MRETRRTPNVFVIGAGPVAATLAGALRRAGVPVLGLFGRRPEAARAAGAVAGVAAFSAAPPDPLLEADTVILAVRDDAIGEVADKLCQTGLITRGHVLLQCSGARSSKETLGHVADKVGGVGTLHPLRSIPDARKAIATMEGTLFGIEGDRRAREVAQFLVESLKGRALDLEGGEMALYHAAASLASNALVGLLDAAAEALSAAGVKRDEALPALLPLVRGTVENLAEQGIPKALTGPIVRGDVTTVTRHLEGLRKASPGLLSLYGVLGRRLVSLARARGDASDRDLDEIERLLEATG